MDPVLVELPRMSSSISTPTRVRTRKRSGHRVTRSCSHFERPDSTRREKIVDGLRQQMTTVNSRLEAAIVHRVDPIGDVVLLSLRNRRTVFEIEIYIGSGRKSFALHHEGCLASIPQTG